MQYQYRTPLNVCSATILACFCTAGSLSPCGGSDLASPSSSYTLGDHTVATSVFHWYTSDGGQLTGPWRPVDGRDNWTGEPNWWKTQVKQMMSANIDILYVHLIPVGEEQRVNLFQALYELRQEGYRTPKVAPFLDPIITWDILPTVDLATTEGKDIFVGQYVRFFEQYFSRNTDEYAGDYLHQMDGRVVLDSWHLGSNVRNPFLLNKSDLEERLSAAFVEEHPVFDNGIYMITAANQNLKFTDEQVHQFQVHEYFETRQYHGIVSVQLKGGYWDQNIRDPGYLLPRDGGTHYQDAWDQVAADPDIDRVYIESWNEYDEGSGIYAADPGDPFIRPGSAADQLGSTDDWSDTDDPFEYIRTTAEGARQFNETPDYDAAVLAHGIPAAMRPGETRTVTVTLRNEGDLSWTGAEGFAFAQRNGGVQTEFTAGPVFIDDSENEIPQYGGVFRGRPITMQLEITAPETSGKYAASWQMLQDLVPPEYTGSRLFNWHENAPDSTQEQPPGLVTVVESSSPYPGDSPQDALGAVGGVESHTFIFHDDGVVDNGNAILGDEGETVDFIRFETDVPVTLDGYTINLQTDYGQQNTYRSTALVRLSIDGTVVDFFDNDGYSRTLDRLFQDGPISGSEFLLELTRVTDGGPRIVEIDAILADGWPIPDRTWFGEILETTISVAIEG